VIDGDGHIVNHWIGFAPGTSGDRLRQSIDQALETVSKAQTGTVVYPR
jgi:hypothetical protein